jgi:hypothetical protein
MFNEMRLWRVWTTASILFGLLALPLQSRAASCTTQAELQPQDRDALASIGGRLAVAVVRQDFPTLQAALLPAEAAEWDGIHDAVERGAQVVKGGQVQLRNLYLLDASTQTATADTQFFCSNSSGSLTVTMNMRSLPPGRYAVALADAALGDGRANWRGAGLGPDVFSGCMEAGGIDGEAGNL